MRKAMMLVAAVAVAVGVLVVPAAPARAYDQGTCNDQFGAANVESVDTIRVDTGSRRVDFGDHPHWGGAPQGTAVVCWHRNGGAMVFGQVFVDGWAYGKKATARVTFFTAEGAARYDDSRSVTDTHEWEAESTSVNGGRTTQLTSALIVFRLRLSYDGEVKYTGTWGR